ncbi:unnamed protein product [Bursaphelenchus xylophilus]|uniref:(pine wood nematode) hypothetical protein n=1 Tax=Bursaphelenchus xylophilus TaxID=6326 RepID=A0A1I7SIM6_BURXY|nr:unnamed protein product [Bursaphelenchus xylophilus]CAG9081335.1 unnamed protein product [Bursaphelenchus xylophilus]
MSSVARISNETASRTNHDPNQFMFTLFPDLSRLVSHTILHRVVTIQVWAWPGSPKFSCPGRAYRFYGPAPAFDFPD